VDIDVAVPLALVAHELLSNVLRHAYPQGKPKAEVHMTEHAGGWILEVADRGAGLPAGFDWTAGKGLGLTIVRLLAERIGARVSVDTTAGTRFTLDIPAHPRPITP
jgi:two-component sensor histidine kinase